MGIPGISSEAKSWGFAGPNSEILPQGSTQAGPAPVAEMAMGLAGITGNTSLSPNPLWTRSSRFPSRAPSGLRPPFLEDLSHLRKTFQYGGMNQGLLALAREA